MTSQLVAGTVSLIQGGFGNLEALVWQGTSLFHYWRDNSNSSFPWHFGATLSSVATGPAVIIESSFRNVPTMPGNFEVLALEGSNIAHYWRDNSDPSHPWRLSEIISSAATAPACMIQASPPSPAIPGNFEALVLEGSNLVHYWRDNSGSGDNFPWHRAEVVSTQATGPAVMIEGSFRSVDPTRPGNFEALVLEGNNIVHYWRDNSTNEYTWHRDAIVSNVATGPATIIQGSYRGTAASPGNFEALVLEGANLVHYWRDNSDTSFPWHRSAVVSTIANRSASLVQGSLGADATHVGNFEALVNEGDAFHYFRANSESGLPWHRTVVV